MRTEVDNWMHSLVSTQRYTESIQVCLCNKMHIIITLSYIIIAISLPPLGFWVLETQNKYIYFTINSFILTTFYPKHKSVSR